MTAELYQMLCLIVLSFPHFLAFCHDSLKSQGKNWDKYSNCVSRQYVSRLDSCAQHCPFRWSHHPLRCLRQRLAILLARLLLGLQSSFGMHCFVIAFLRSCLFSAVLHIRWTASYNERAVQHSFSRPTTSAFAWIAFFFCYLNVLKKRQLSWTLLVFNLHDLIVSLLEPSKR